MAEDSKLRLFVAIELPGRWLEALARLRSELEKTGGGELKWVRPELMHLTLVFLGYQPPEALPAISLALASAGRDVEPFRLTLGTPGWFGQPHNLQVIWVGLADTPPELLHLHRSLVTHLSGSAISFDRKPLVPHITVARGRRPIDRAVSLRVHAALQRLRLPQGLSMEADHFVLMESHLSPFGPAYEVAASFPLGRGE